MLIAIVLFCVGLLFLIKGGDWFVDGATGIAKKFHIPEVLIGATVVSIGTTIPEVMVSVESALIGHGEIAYGNAIGSIICNCALIAAISMTFNPGKVERDALKYPVSFFFVAAAFYVYTAYFTGVFSRMSGIILLLIFLVYMVTTVNKALRMTKSEEVKEEVEVESKLLKNILLLVFGAVAIAVGANLLVDNGTIIAEGLGVPESVIALTFIALGTSLPELITAITALVKGHSELSLGNVIGANLFNLVLVSGAASALSPFTLPLSREINGINASLVVDIPLMLAVMLIVTIPALVKEKDYRAQGIILLCIYVCFCAYQFLG
ncbi:MAG: calcium/sodium antiporter [Sphaerochaetaceae bacterium]|nr:calcium/sodium antiporter [Sphaerochaetaceae bacterium]